MNGSVCSAYYFCQKHLSRTIVVGTRIGSAATASKKEGGRMATAVMEKPKIVLRSNGRVPRAMRARVEALLAENYAFMDSLVFKQRGIEKQLFDFEIEPSLPLTSWYQPTREEIADQLKGTPQLMKAPEEKLMFLRFNYSKFRLQKLQKKLLKDGIDKETAEQFLEWHRRFEHFREYLVRT